MCGRVTRYFGRHHWGILATFIALGGTAYAATETGQHRGVIHGCVDRKTGAVRIVGSNACRLGERAIAWSQAGPVGPSDGYFSSTGAE